MESRLSVESAMRVLESVPISLHCWQGDDVGGFEVELKTLPAGAAWDYYCLSHNAPVGADWMAEARRYEHAVLSRRG
ncbi:MAG TPA: L-rhamnose isomerase [Thermoguttaceae bacterium]|nr:L-rhamnose isomerase [Thermoguttaceae bacterium]